MCGKCLESKWKVYRKCKEIIYKKVIEKHDTKYDIKVRYQIMI